MPIYLYKCLKCGEVYDRIINKEEDIPTDCLDAKCGGKLERSMADEGINIGEHSGEQEECPIEKLKKLKIIGQISPTTFFAVE